MRTLTLFTVDDQWPLEESPYRYEPDEPEDGDDPTPLELDDEHWESLIPDDDYEPLPEQGDFWTDDD